MSVILPPGRPAIQTGMSNEMIHRRLIAEATNRILQGHINATLTLTLDPNVGQTAVVDSRISPQTCASLSPATANAATALGTTFIVCGTGSLVVSHANNAQTDRVFLLSLIG